MNAKEALKCKVATSVEVSLLLLESVVVLHGVDPDATYQNVYNIVCSQVSASRLQLEDCEILCKLFGGFKGTDLTLSVLGDEFLDQNPVYVHGQKRKQAKVPVAKAIAAGLVVAMPKEFAMDVALQEVVMGWFKAFVERIQEDFKDAGFEELYPEQGSSVVVGSLVHDMYAVTRFSEGM